MAKTVYQRMGKVAWIARWFYQYIKTPLLYELGYAEIRTAADLIQEIRDNQRADVIKLNISPSVSVEIRKKGKR